MSVTDILVPRRADLPGVVAVSLGGSRTRGTHRPDSDRGIGVYYRGSFGAGFLAELGYDGHGYNPPRPPWSGYSKVDSRARRPC